jgi:hypothetical protein
MKRREFITLLGSAAAAWPLPARAQQPGRRPTIGFLGTGSSVAWTQWTAAFVRRLGELGWIDGRNVTIEYRWAEGRAERFAEIAAELVRLKVDVIVTLGVAGVAAKQATSAIPIVLAIATAAATTSAGVRRSMSCIREQPTEGVRPNARENGRIRPSTRRSGFPSVGSGQHPASVLQEGRENANIDAGLGFIWRISVYAALGIHSGNVQKHKILISVAWVTHGAL